jgi:hypothetical protein
MRRFLIVAAVAAVATGAWWLAEDGNLRRHLGQFGDAVLVRAGMGPEPSWGDVADKIGEFADEERDLKAAVGGSQVAPDPPLPAAPPG